VNPEVKHLGILQLSDGNCLGMDLTLPMEVLCRTRALQPHTSGSNYIILGVASCRSAVSCNIVATASKNLNHQDNDPDSSRLEAGQQIATCNKHSIPTRSSPAQADARPRCYLQSGVCARAGVYFREVDAVKHEQT